MELSPSIHKFVNEFITSGLSAALGHEPFGSELKAELLGPNGVSIILKEDLLIYVTIIANRSTKAIIDMDFSELKELRNSLGKHDVSARLEFTAQKGLHTV